jgi:hypothetical protein
MMMMMMMIWEEGILVHFKVALRISPTGAEENKEKFTVRIVHQQQETTYSTLDAMTCFSIFYPFSNHKYWNCKVERKWINKNYSTPRIYVQCSSGVIETQYFAQSAHKNCSQSSSIDYQVAGPFMDSFWPDQINSLPHTVCGNSFHSFNNVWRFSLYTV